MSPMKQLFRVAAVVLALGLFTGCESTDGGGGVSGSVYYGAGFYHPWDTTAATMTTRISSSRRPTGRIGRYARSNRSHGRPPRANGQRPRFPPRRGRRFAAGAAGDEP